MIPSAARVLERWLGPAMTPLAGALRFVAWMAFAAVLIGLVVRAARALRAYRHGWETAPVVRCRECGGLAADAASPFCPAGHAVVFPPGAARREELRSAGKEGFGGRRRTFVGMAGMAAGVALLAAAIAGASAYRIADGSAPPLAAIPASGGFLFFAAGLAAASRALSPERRGVPDRALSAAAALAALVPAGVLLALSRGIDPPAPRLIGSVWSTPTGLYVAHGARARAKNEGPPAPRVEADVITVRSQVFGFSWTGVARLRAQARAIPWRGRGGIAARLVDRLGPRAGGALLAVQRERREAAVPPNVRIWIFASRSDVSFSASGGDVPSGRPDR